MASSTQTLNRLNFATRKEAAERLSRSITEALRNAIRMRGRATAIVGGGSTPRYLYDLLSRIELPWDKVALIPSDERWVPKNSIHSNEKFIRESLVKGNAFSAQLLPMYWENSTPENAARFVNKALGQIVSPVDVTVLGMGLDGHIASVFPDAPNLTAGLAGGAPCTVQPLPQTGETRLTLTVPFLLHSRQLNLLFFGEDKNRVFKLAQKDKSANRYPVTAILKQQQVPINVYWSP